MSTPDKLTQSAIAEIEARAKAATPGPWFAVRICHDFVIATGDSYDAPIVTASGDELGVGSVAQAAANAKFLAYAREDIPRLTSALAAAEGGGGLGDLPEAIRSPLRVVEEGVDRNAAGELMSQTYPHQGFSIYDSSHRRICHTHDEQIARAIVSLAALAAATPTPQPETAGPDSFREKLTADVWTMLASGEALREQYVQAFAEQRGTIADLQRRLEAYQQWEKNRNESEQSLNAQAPCGHPVQLKMGWEDGKVHCWECEWMDSQKQLAAAQDAKEHYYDQHTALYGQWAEIKQQLAAVNMLLDQMGAPNTACGGEGDAEVQMNVFDRLRSLARKQADLQRRLEEAERENDRLRRLFQAGFDVQRVLEWQKSKPRRSPSDAFTAGGERQAAYLIEDEARTLTVHRDKLLGLLREARDWIDPRTDPGRQTAREIVAQIDAALGEQE